MYLTFAIDFYCRGSQIKLRAVLGCDWSINCFSGEIVKELAEADTASYTRFTDAKCDSAGRLWCGTVAKDITIRDAGAFYCFTQGRPPCVMFSAMQAFDYVLVTCRKSDQVCVSSEYLQWHWLD